MFLAKKVGKPSKVQTKRVTRFHFLLASVKKSIIVRIRRGLITVRNVMSTMFGVIPMAK